jgi:hypothetical protein
MIACWRRVGIAIGPALVLSLAGCSEGAVDHLPRQAVAGKVTLDDRPLERGPITFDPADPGRPDAVSAGAVIVDGSYAIGRSGGPTPGRHRVAILGGAGDADPPAGDAPGPRPRPSAGKKPTVPEKYNAQSTLTAEVKGDASNMINYEMKSQ